MALIAVWVCGQIHRDRWGQRTDDDDTWNDADGKEETDGRQMHRQIDDRQRMHKYDR